MTEDEGSVSVWTRRLGPWSYTGSHDGNESGARPWLHRTKSAHKRRHVQRDVGAQTPKSGRNFQDSISTVRTWADPK